MVSFSSRHLRAQKKSPAFRQCIFRAARFFPCKILHFLIWVFRTGSCEMGFCRSDWRIFIGHHRSRRTKTPENGESLLRHQTHSRTHQRHTMSALTFSASVVKAVVPTSSACRTTARRAAVKVQANMWPVRRALYLFREVGRASRSFTRDRPLMKKLSTLSDHESPLSPHRSPAPTPAPPTRTPRPLWATMTCCPCPKPRSTK